eukprot:Selendium_serpulae@DN4414_c0_g1_i6.p1
MRLPPSVPIKAATITIPGPDHIWCSCMNDDASIIAVSNAKAVRLFQFNFAKLEVRQLKAPKALEMAPGYSMKFVNLQWLAVCQQEKSSSGFFLSIYDLSTEDMCEVVCFRRLEYAVRTITVSKDKQWLASVDVVGGARVFSLDTFALHCCLPAPRDGSPILHTAFGHRRSEVAVASATNLLYFFNLENRQLSRRIVEQDGSLGYVSIPTRHLSPSDGRISSLLWLQGDIDADKIVIQSANAYCTLTIADNETSKTKRRKSEKPSPTAEPLTTLNWAGSRKHRHNWSLSTVEMARWLGSGESQSKSKEKAELLVGTAVAEKMLVNCRSSLFDRKRYAT